MYHIPRFCGENFSGERGKKKGGGGGWVRVLQCVFEKMKIEYAVSMSFFHRCKA